MSGNLSYAPRISIVTIEKAIMHIKNVYIDNIHNINFIIFNFKTLFCS